MRYSTRARDSDIHEELERQHGEPRKRRKLASGQGLDVQNEVIVVESEDGKTLTTGVNDQTAQHAAQEESPYESDQSQESEEEEIPEVRHEQDIPKKL